MTHPADCDRCARGQAPDVHLYLPRSPQRAGTVRGRALPPPSGIPRRSYSDGGPVAGDVNPRLTDDIVPGLHAVGRPQHLEPGRALPLRAAYGVAGASVAFVAVYLLMGHWFGQTGKAAVVWLLHTALLLGLLAGGLLLFSTALPDNDREVDDG